MSTFNQEARRCAPRATLLIRLLVGAVFLSEGLQKFLFAADVGAGRFAKIGLPHPELLAPLAGSFEVICGTLVIFGGLTRLAVIPLLVVISTASVTTKVPIYEHEGFWKMAHEARTDYAMVMGLLFLLTVGAGPWSWDGRRAAQKARSTSSHIAPLPETVSTKVTPPSAGSPADRPGAAG